MALNFDFSSLNFGGNDQVSNPMMRPVNLDQLNFSEPATQSSSFKDKVIDFGKSFLGTITELARADPDVQIGSTTSAFSGMTRPGVLDTAESGLAFQNPAKTLGLGIYNPSLDDLQSYSTEPSFGQSNAPFSFFDQDAINAEEARNLYEDEINNRDYEPTEQEYCEGRFGKGISIEQCRLRINEENISEAIARGGPGAQFIDTQGTNPMLDYRAPILGQQDFSSDLSGAEASFVLPNGEVRTIMPGQDVASAFGRERGTSTFPVDEGSVTVPSELLAETMGLTPSLEDIQNVQPPEVAPDDRSSFLAESAAREQRLRDRERQTGETPAERDTRTAKLRQQQRSSSDMSFDQARKFVTRREYSNGKKESVSSFNDRIRAFKELYNSDNSKIEREAERLANEGRRINNERVQAVIDNYQKTESEKYNDVLNVGQKMLADGILKTEQDLVLFIVDRMKGDISEIFDPFIDIGGGDDGKVVTSSLGSGVYNAQQEANIKRVLEVYPNLTREQAIEEMQKQGKL